MAPRSAEQTELSRCEYDATQSLLQDKVIKVTGRATRVGPRQEWEAARDLRQEAPPKWPEIFQGFILSDRGVLSLPTPLPVLLDHFLHKLHRDSGS